MSIIYGATDWLDAPPAGVATCASVSKLRGKLTPEDLKARRPSMHLVRCVRCVR